MWLVVKHVLSHSKSVPGLVDPQDGGSDKWEHIIFNEEINLINAQSSVVHGWGKKTVIKKKKQWEWELILSNWFQYHYSLK